MIVPITFLRYCGYISLDDESTEDHLSTTELLDEHLRNVVVDDAISDDDSETAIKTAQRIETLSKAVANLRKAETEQKRVELQVLEAQQRKYINWDVLIPKLFGIAVTGGVTIFWLCMEQGTPVPMRLVQMTNALTMQRV